MKIHFWMPHIKLAGGPRVTLTYANKLVSMGHEVTVFIPVQSHLHRIVGNVFHRKPAWFPELQARIHRVARWSDLDIGQPDVIVADSWQVTRELLKKQTSVPRFQLIQHDERLFHGEPDEVGRTYASKDIKKIVVATWLSDMVRDSFGQDSILLLNPYDRTLFHPVSKKSHPEIRILLLDHTFTWKGTKEGVEIVEELKEKYQNVKLVGYGARQETPEYTYDEYHYKIPQEKLAELYSSVDIFLCPSWMEGFGLPSLEALACGTPVVTYDNGGSRDFCIDGKTSLVAKNGDRQDLKNKLEMLIADRDLREKLAKNGLEFVQSMPTLKEQAQKLEKIFSEESDK